MPAVAARTAIRSKASRTTGSGCSREMAIRVLARSMMGWPLRLLSSMVTRRPSAAQASQKARKKRGSLKVKLLVMAWLESPTRTRLPEPPCSGAVSRLMSLFWAGVESWASSSITKRWRFWYQRRRDSLVSKRAIACWTWSS
ncbi:hypothetical protein D3C86_1309250 [compost metagenome]